MNIEQFTNILVTITLAELMVAVGLGVSLGELKRVAGNGRLLARAAVANYVCVPVAAAGLLLLCQAEPLVAAGFLITAVCPGAPYGPPLTAMAKGDLACSVGLMVVLAGSSALVAPLLLWLLLPVVAGGEALNVDVLRMVVTLVLVQLLPLGFGLAIRHGRPGLAARLIRPANLLSLILNLSVIGLILVVHFQSLASIRPRGYAGMSALVLCALGAGWLLGLPGGGGRKTLAIATSVRNVGVGMVIATSSFPGSRAVTATMVFGLFQTILLAIVALGWGRWASGLSRSATVAARDDNHG